jgi:outer membrane lipoprotein carrier protein
MNSVAFSATEFMPKSFQLEFEQVFKSLLSGQEKKSKGQLLYLYPSQIKLEIGEKSDRTVLVANTEKMWFYRSPLPGDKGELVERMVAKTGLVRFFDVLKKGLITNPLYSVEKVGERFLLKFATNVSRETELKSAILTFKNKANLFSNLDSIDLEYVSGKKVKMVALSMKSNLNLGAQDFTFTPPENTKIIRE